MRLKGLEPPRLSAPDPKSGVATNYTTAAVDCGAKVVLFSFYANVFSILSTENTILFPGFQITSSDR